MSMNGKKPLAISCLLEARSMIYQVLLPTRKRSSRSIFKDISHPESPQKPNTLRRQLTDTFEIMRASKSFATQPQILIQSHRLHDFLNALSHNILTLFHSTNFKRWMQTLPIHLQTMKQDTKEKHNDILTSCSK